MSPTFTLPKNTNKHKALSLHGVTHKSSVLNEKNISFLYNQSALSTREIAEKYHISKWRIISFMRRNNMARRTPAETLHIQFERKSLTFNKLSDFGQRQKSLLIAALMLYWAEGSKAGKYTVDFANSNTEMLQVFIKALRVIYRITEDKLRIYTYCFSNQDKEEIIEYWSKNLKVPKIQFTKPYVRSDFKVEKSGKMPRGLVHVRYSDMKLHRQIISDIAIIASELLSWDG